MHSKIYDVDGVLIIDKPAGITSHDVVDRVRRILETRRIGHTGTLDPFATGVMVVLVGRATRLAQFLDKDEKEYEATIRFGFETDTGDVTGVRRVAMGDAIGTAEQVGEVLAKIDRTTLLAQFTGKIEQMPPMYSAKKVAGKKLYQHARKGETVDRQPVDVTISALEIMDDAVSDPSSERRIRVACSAGTYIRTLAEDIGRAVGTGAHLVELRRTRSGRFGLEQSVSLDALGKLDAPATQLLPVSEAVAHLPSLTMAENRVQATENGLPTRIDALRGADGSALKMMAGDGTLLAVGIYSEAERSIKPKVVLV